MTSVTIVSVKKKYGFLEWVNDILNQQYCGICKLYFHKVEYMRHIIKHDTWPDKWPYSASELPADTPLP